MAILPLQNFSTMVQNMAAAVQGAAATLVDLTVGSVLRATLEASASVGLWLQYLIIQVLAISRAATSTGADLDTWVADYGLVARLPGSLAAGTVTFARFSPGQQAVIPLGTLVRSSDGTQTFQSTAAVTIPAVATSADVPVQALVVGSAGNVAAGSVSLLVTPVSYVDTISNAAPFTNGLDAESDAALLARSQSAFQALSKGTVAAISAAVATVQQGLRYVVLPATDTLGNAAPGYVTVVVDDGSGNAAPALLLSVLTAISAVRAAGIQVAAVAPQVVPVTVALSIITSPADAHDAVGAAVSAAVAAYVAGQPDGGRVIASRISYLAQAADPRVLEVVGILINGSAGDLQLGPMQVAVVSGVAVT